MVGDSAKEVSEYTEAVRLGLDQWDLFMNLGLAYLDQEELGKAVSALEIAVLLGPDHPETHFNLALAYERNHRLPAALWEISTSLRLAPNDPDERNTRAIIYAELGDRRCAREEWVRLLQVAPDYVPARANLAILDRPTMSAPELAQRPEGRPLLTKLSRNRSVDKVEPTFIATILSCRTLIVPRRWISIGSGSNRPTIFVRFDLGGERGESCHPESRKTFLRFS